MSAPPTTRASRSRYSSPAVGGAGLGASSGAGGVAGARSRNSNDSSSRDRERDGGGRGRESRDASSSLDRSRQFMEAWIEPERARLASFQEDGLVRQGVLETMEPLGARPRPAVFKKLFGAGSPFHREGSAAVAGQDGNASSPAARKTGAKRIVVLKRKNGNGDKTAASDGNSGANGRPNLSVSVSGTQSPTPSTTVATPQPENEPEAELQPARSLTASSTPAPLADSEALPEPLPETHSPIPTPTASAATDHRTSTLILPTSDTIQPEPEDILSADLTPTPRMQPEPVSGSSPTPQPASYDSPSRLPSVPPSVPSTGLVPSIAQAAMFPPSYASNPFLPDPIKQSIEGPPSLPAHLPTTPRSVTSYNDADDSTFFKRESSAQSAPIPDMAHTKAAESQQARARTGSASASASAGTAPAHLPNSHHTAPAPQAQAQAPQQAGPYLTEAEMARIVQPLQKEVVTKAFDYGVEECLKLHHYDKAYAYRQVYDEYHDNPQFLLLAESIFRQTASKDAVFRWGLLIQDKIAEGQRDKTAVRYFVPEARDNKDFVPHQPQPAPYRDLITLDLSRLQELAGDSDSKKRTHDETRDESVPKSESQPQPQPEHQEVQNKNQPDLQSKKIAETEPERVATPPRPPKRQKLQTRESSSARSTGRKTASRGMNGRENASPSRRKTRSGSVASDSSLSSARSVTPPPPPTQETSEDNRMQDVGDIQASASAGVVDGEPPSSTHAGTANASAQEPEHAAQSQPMTTRPRRAPARRSRNAIASQPDSNNSQPQNSSSTNSPAVSGAPAPPPQQRSRNPRRGAPDFTPSQKLDENDEVTKRRRAAKQFTINLTNKARSQVISDVRHEPRPGEPMREQSPQSDLSSVPEVEELEPTPPPPPPPPPPAAAAAAAVQSGRGARAARAHKRQHDQVDEDEDVQAISPGFPPAEPSTGVTSRAATPVRPAKRPRTGPRLKVS
ncbi:hypothetical protein VP1G_07567 [Cytospora mali]|uniref:Uncharacterized protein n=1 Tax=Cytospora mali TaxID=578113 RepID=A0A194V8S7_CYTMA|nr:hypothetical protein VP1G_07567 [Valsa mali var. pyri (nom. inval.)]